jgi:nitrate reductase gamma subunit
MIDQILFGIFPYVAIALAVSGGLYRYFVDRYSWSSQSSQFLENRALYWGSVPWHYAILVVLLAHFLAFLFPSGWGELLGRPVRLYLMEVTGMALGATAVLSVVLLLGRRAMNSRVAAVTSAIDWLVLASLLLQVATGVAIAATLRWGAVWYLHIVVPWLWSLITLHPQVQYLAVMPAVVKVHAVNAFVLLALFPYSRLVHIISVPLTYLARPYQVVVWNRRAGQ